MNALRECAEFIVRLGTLARGRLRARLLSARGARVGAKSSLGARCMVDRPGGVGLGERVVLEADVYLKLVSDLAMLEIGNHAFIGRGVQFDVIHRVCVGSHTLIAPRCFISDHAHGIAPGLRIDEQSCATGAVLIGSDVWLGAGSVVLPGVSIGDGAVVGANSVVTQNVAPMTVVAGAPARLLRHRAQLDTPLDAALDGSRAQ